jgi:hypothetical protein
VRRTVLEPQLCRERFDAPLRRSPAELPAECLRLEGFFGKAPEQGHLRFRHRLFDGCTVAVRRESSSRGVMHRSFSAVFAALMPGAPIRFPRAFGFGQRCVPPRVPPELSAKNLLFRHDLLDYRSGREEGTA